MSRRQISIRQLEVLDAMGREGSVTAAAQVLHLTQPAVSMQIRQLEETLGVALFEPVGRGLQMTEPGRELAAIAADLLIRLDNFTRTASEIRGVKRGRVRLGIVSTAKYFVPRLLARFLEAHPGMELKLSVFNRENIIEQLQSYNIDLGIMGRPPEGGTLTGIPFAANPLAIVASPAHRLSRKSNIAPEELENEPFIVRETGSGTRHALERFLADYSLSIKPIMETDSNETIKQSIMAGIGIGMLSLHTVRLEQATDRLITLPVAGLPLRRQWFAVRCRDRQLTPAADEFLQYLLREADDLMRAGI